MEANFNFNSQVCTNKVQSERLLALGLKKETADMSWSNVLNDGNREWMLIPLPIGAYTDTEIPAWSLHRLYELYNSPTPLIDSIQLIPHLYDMIIDKLEALITKGYFNKEYLV